jgi:hypothetical protein
MDVPFTDLNQVLLVLVLLGILVAATGAVWVGRNGWPTPYNVSEVYRAGWDSVVWAAQIGKDVVDYDGWVWRAGVRAGKRYARRRPLGLFATHEGLAAIRLALADAERRGDVAATRDFRALLSIPGEQ